MDKRHIQAFLLSSAAFFSMSLPARTFGSDMLAAAVSHTVQIAAAGVGNESESGKDDPSAAVEACAHRS
jgi:hypothetical protein